MLARIWQGAENLGNRVEGLDMAVVLLQSLEEARIFNCRRRLSSKSKSQAYIPDVPRLGSEVGNADKAADSSRRYQRQEHQRADSCLLAKSGGEQGRNKGIINHHRLTAFLYQRTARPSLSRAAITSGLSRCDESCVDT